MRTGVDVRVSTAMRSASCEIKPRIVLLKSTNAFSSLFSMCSGSHSSSLLATMPDVKLVGGSESLLRCKRKSSMRCAGAACPSPCSFASRSRCVRQYKPARAGQSPAFLINSSGMSSGRVSTTIAAFDHFELRLLDDIPFTTISSSLVADGTTKPPGHMQKE